MLMMSSVKDMLLIGLVRPMVVVAHGLYILIVVYVELVCKSMRVGHAIQIWFEMLNNHSSFNFY